MCNRSFPMFPPPATAILLALALTVGMGDIFAGRRWEPIGPGGGSVTAIVIHPENPEILYTLVRTDDSPTHRVYRSFDEGLSWSTHNRGLPPDLSLTAIAIDPAAADTAYLGTESEGVFRSRSGTDWNPVNVGLTNQSVAALAVDPNTSTVYLSTVGDGIFRSNNGGEAWEAFSSLLSVQYLKVLAVNPATSTIYAGSSGLLARRYKDGSGWENVSDVSGSHALAVAPDGSAVYSATGDALHRSLDDGDTWTALQDEVLSSRVEVLATDPSWPKVLYAGWSNRFVRSENGGDSWIPLTLPRFCDITGLGVGSDSPGQVYVGLRQDGIFRSEDRGESWTESNTGLSTRSISSVQVDPQDPTTLYAVERAAGVFRSRDAGISWSHEQPPGIPYGPLRIDPTSSATLYLGTSKGLYTSIDEGDTWRSITDDLCSGPEIHLPPSGTLRRCPAVFDFVLDPLRPRTIYFLGGMGIYRTDDGGLNWDHFSVGSDLEPTVLAIDPVTPSTLYVGDFGGERLGIFKSTDRGETWRRISNGLPVGWVSALAVDPLVPSTLYAAIADAGLFSSGDGGEHWGEIGSVLPTERVLDMLIDPITPSTLYVSSLDDGIFEGLDGGNNWTPLNDGLSGLPALTFALDADSTHLYVGTEAGGIYRLQEDFAIYFAQFGNGEGLTSEVVLINPSRSTTANGNIEFFDDEGAPFSIVQAVSNTDGPSSQILTAVTASTFEFSIAPLGTVSIATDGRGDLAAGSASVTSETPVSGVIRFSIPGVGIAGVGPSQALTGFVVPVRRKSGLINTGIAIHNVGSQAVGLELTLRDSQGQVVAETNTVNLTGRGHLARFIGGTGDAFFAQVDTDDFEGTIAVKVRGGKVTATSLELGTRPGEFTTLPVTPLQ